MEKPQADIRGVFCALHAFMKVSLLQQPYLCPTIHPLQIFIILAPTPSHECSNFDTKHCETGLVSVNVI